MSRCFIAWTMCVLVASCAAEGVGTDSAGDSTASLEVSLCVLTIDCGGFCGTEAEVRRFLATCRSRTADRGPSGPCFSDCWNVCLHRSSHSGRLTACTLQCMVGRCPADAAATGLIMAGHAECPSPDPSTICPLYYAPVVCAGECMYSNQCFASGAGFGPGACTDAEPAPL